MPTAEQFSRYIKLPGGGLWFSEFAVGNTNKGIRYSVKCNDSETIRTFKRFDRVRTFITDAIANVHPEFGAYMRYSKFLEARRPHIAKSIQANGEYIRIELQRRLGRLLYSYAVSGTSPIDARKQVAKAWEDVLNGKPRWWAIKRAQVEFGFHRYTIRGYGEPRSEGDIIAQEQVLYKEREIMKRKAKRGEGPVRASIRSKLKNYRNYTGGTYEL